MARFEYLLKWCIYSTVWLLHGWCHVKLLSSQRVCSVYTIQPCTMPCHFIQSHICMVHACLAVTRHLHFWQNDRDFLRANAVVWNGYRNESAQKVDPVEEKLSRRSCRDSKPATCRSRVRCPNHWALLAPQSQQTCVCWSMWWFVALCDQQTDPRCHHDFYSNRQVALLASMTSETVKESVFSACDWERFKLNVVFMTPKFIPHWSRQTQVLSFVATNSCFVVCRDKNLRFGSSRQCS